ncbi:MAG TPA: PQQ-dependent sugar dehydrogenase [Nannocystis sp.]
MRANARSSWILALAVVAACTEKPTAETSTSTGESSTGEGSTSDPSTGEPPWPMLPPRPAVQTCRFDGQAPGVLAPLEFAQIFAGAGLSEIVDVVPADAEGRVIVGERGGRILSGSVDVGTLSPVLDLGARGRIVALATPPDFAATGHLFVRYEAKEGAPRAVIARFTVDLGTWTADPTSERGVMEIADAVGPRGGGALVFDAAGMLVIGVGDLAEPTVAQDPTVRAGKLLRVDVGGLDQGVVAPAPDNPLVGQGGYAELVWATGLRDPWRCAVADAGALWCVDVGETEHEVDRVTAGANLGWPQVEGSVCRLPGGDCSDLPATPPSATYRAGDGDCGISGALLGIAPGLETTLVYGDRCSGRLRGVDTADPGFFVQEEILAVEPSGVIALGRDGRGEALAITGDARVVRLDVAPPPGKFPLRLSESQCFADLVTLTPVPGVVPYGVRADLWTDGAIKDRFIALPADAAISIGGDGSFEFPIGTVLLKTFSFEFVAGDPSSRRAVETRVMVRREHGWQFHSYRWNAAGTDADLLTSGAMDTLELSEDGAQVALEYMWPSRGSCKVCHGFGSSRALGPGVAQLNWEYDYGEGRGNQLLVLAELGMFTAPLAGDPAALPKIPGLTDPEAPAEARARAYLHANCGHCHRPGGWTPPDLTMDLRWTTSLADAHICGVAAQYPYPWFSGELRIAPGDPEASVIWQRLSHRGPGQMPPLGTTRVDPRAEVVYAWIAGLSACP